MNDLIQEHLNGFERRREENEKLHVENIKRFDGIEETLRLQNRMLTEITDVGKEVKDQVKWTNGQVRNLKEWRAYITGGLTVVTMLLVPVLIFMLTHPKV